MKFDTILCHYAEVGLKIGNRRFFENWLKQNIKSSLLKVITKDTFDIERINGRILVELNTDLSKNKKDISSALSQTFGIAYFAFAKTVPQDIRIIREESLSILNTLLLAKGVNDAAEAAKKQEKDRSAFLLFKSLFVRIAIILIGFYVGIVYLVLEALQILVAFALAQIGYVFYKTKYIFVYKI